MRAVLYTHELEPITVVSIPPTLWAMLQRGDWIAIPVCESVPMRVNAEVPPRSFYFKVVHIRGERLRYNGRETLMLLTRDEEHAMLLRPDYLPGQRTDLQRREREAFLEGVAAGIEGFLGGE